MMPFLMSMISSIHVHLGLHLVHVTPLTMNLLMPLTTALIGHHQTCTNKINCFSSFYPQREKPLDSNRCSHFLFYPKLIASCSIINSNAHIQLEHNQQHSDTSCDCLASKAIYSDLYWFLV